METFIRGLVALGITLLVATFVWSQEPKPAAPAPPAGAPVQYYGPGPGYQDNGTGWSPFMLHYFDRRDANVGGGCLGNNTRGAQFNIQRLNSNKGGCFRGPRTQPGTLVFPQHPFARSPRDFFMID